MKTLTIDRNGGGDNLKITGAVTGPVELNQNDLFKRRLKVCAW